MAKKMGLGRGIDALFDVSGSSAVNINHQDIGKENITKIRISLIEPNQSQPRKEFNNESLSELADSITAHGVIQPIAVRRLENGYYRIIAGERRWRASKMAGIDEIPAIVHDVDEAAAAKMTLIENLQREDLNPVEEAQGYISLAERYSLTQEEIAKQVSKSRSVIANSMRLLTLPPQILDLLRNQKITTGHAKILLSLDDNEAKIVLAEKIVKYDLSVRDIEKYVRGKKNSESNKNLFDKSDAELYIKSIQQKMIKTMGTAVKILPKEGKPSGKLEISYKDSLQLESLIRMLCGDGIFDDD